MLRSNHTPNLFKSNKKVKRPSLRNIFRTLLCTIIGAYTLLLAILNFSPTEQFLTRQIAQALSNRLGTEVTIGHIEVGLFNRLTLKEVNIKDLKKKDLLQAGLISCKIELRSLFKHQLSLRTVSLLDTSVNLYKEKSDSATNYQFLLDAFASKEPHKKTAIDLRINSIILRRVAFQYNELYKLSKPGKLDFAHLSVKDLNANVSLKSITPQSINLRVRSLSFKEKSGLDIRQLHFKLNANRQNAQIEDFCLEMPHTHFQQTSLLATYDIRKGFSTFASTLHIGATLKDLQVATSDLRPLIKLPTGMDATIRFSTSLLLTPQKLQLNQFSAHTTDNKFKIQTDLTWNRQGGKWLTASVNIKQLFVGAPLGSNIAQWTGLKEKDAQLIARIGDINASAHVLIKDKHHATGALILHTTVGQVAADATWDSSLLSVKSQLTDVRPSVIFNNPKLPTRASLHASIKSDFNKKSAPSLWANINISALEWNNICYGGIHLTGNYDGKIISASLKSQDARAQFAVKGDASLVGKKLANINLQAQIDHLVPSQLGIHTPYGAAAFSGSVQASLSGLGSTLPWGNVSIRHFHMQNGPRGNYQLDHFTAQLQRHASLQSSLHIDSDFLDADIQGNLQPQSIINGVTALLHRALPTIIPSAGATSASQQWTIDTRLKDTDFLKQMLGVDIQAGGTLRLRGTLNTGNGRTWLTASTPSLTISGQHFDKPSIYLSGEGSLYNCLVQAQKGISGHDYHVAVNFKTQEGKLLTQIGWSDTDSKAYSGKFESETEFIRGGQKIGFHMNIHPTEFALDHMPWNISSGQLSYINHQLAINSVSISSQDQALSVSGKVGAGRNDSIVARLKNVDINYILDLINFDAVAFGGNATGTASFTQEGNHPQVHAHLNVPNFTFNNGPMGRANISANWNKADNRINLNASMHLPRTVDDGTELQGYVSLAEKGLDLHINTHHTDLRFLRRYINGIFDDFTGDATGALRLYGPFKKLDFEGKLTANAEATIPVTGVRYKVSNGQVELGPGYFKFNDFIISDKRGGSGIANGTLRHTHLKNLNYDFTLAATHLLCYNQQKQSGMPFYSTTTGSGTVQLKGMPGQFMADIALTPETPTTFVYDLSSQTAFSKDDQMIHFHSRRPANDRNLLLASNNKEEEDSIDTDVPTQNMGTDMRLNFFIDTNPSAQIKIITDARADDAITAYGVGPIRASWHNKGGFEMYGTYKVVRGDYKLSLQDVIRKDLTLQEGSTITFGGNPLDANLALKALYTVNGVPLSDLNYGAGFTQKTVRADCILNIGGKARAPQVDFDLDLHNISSDEKQMVRQLISTEEDMSRQVICLLGMGRFLTTTPSSVSTAEQGNGVSGTAMRSFLSSTLTGQLNSAIASALGGQSRWTFGTNFIPGSTGWDEMEVDGLLQGRLFNDRLLINGNFGYRDHPTYTSNFVGDFDIRYLLTPRGNISLRAYSETNDRYFTKSSLTTQGVGISLQKDFTNFLDLFRRKKRTQTAIPSR